METRTNLNMVLMSKRLDTLIPADEALNIVLSGVKPTDTETVNLQEAANRIISEDLAALRTQPPFDASAMDGYAVRSADIGSLPVSLNVVGESRAGVPFSGNLGAMEAVRIFTGAVVPEAADSIIIQENTKPGEGGLVEILSGVEPGKFIRPAGLDFTEGDTLLRSGEALTSSRLALAASMNHAELQVYKRPTVALISTGDELVMPGEATSPGQIIASNTFGLASSITNCGASLIDLGIVIDTREALFDALKEAVNLGADMVVTTGGASVGDHDLVLPVAQDFGFEFTIAKIAMRPGKPFLFGTLEHAGKTVYLTGLAGNPVSSLVAFNVFVKPLIEALSGTKAGGMRYLNARLGCDLPENDERAEYMRAVTSTNSSGDRIATPFAKQDSSMLANLVRADCLVYRPVRAPAAKMGDQCEIVLIA